MEVSPAITEFADQVLPVDDVDKYDEEDEDLCQICRSPEKSGNSLKYPCACRGSIMYVHEECLRLWLDRRRGNKKCEPVPASRCTALVEAYKIDHNKARVKSLRSAIIETFPEPNKQLLLRILKMMHTITSHSCENGMTSSAVAGCMSPLLLRPLLAGECDLEGFDSLGDNSAQLLAPNDDNGVLLSRKPSGSSGFSGSDLYDYKVTGVEALKAFLTPYHPPTSRSNLEDMERKVHTLRLQLKSEALKLLSACCGYHSLSCASSIIVNGHVGCINGVELSLLHRPYEVWLGYSFDSLIIRNYGIKLSGFLGDTMQLARFWDSSRLTLGGSSLEALTSDPKFLGGTETKEEANLFANISMKTISSKGKLKHDGSERKTVMIISPVEELQKDYRQSWISYSELDSVSTRKQLQVDFLGVIGRDVLAGFKTYLGLCFALAWISTAEATKKVVLSVDEDCIVHYKEYSFPCYIGIAVLLLLCGLLFTSGRRKNRPKDIGEKIPKEEKEPKEEEKTPKEEEKTPKEEEKTPKEEEEKKPKEEEKPDEDSEMMLWQDYLCGPWLKIKKRPKLSVREKGIGDMVVGLFETRIVSIKRVETSPLIMNEIALMRLADENPHILRYYCHEAEAGCVYIGVERFICTFKELLLFWKENGNLSVLSSLERVLLRHPLWTNDDKPLPLLIKLLRDVVKGVAYLHSKSIVHRDLHLDNIVIVFDGQTLSAKIGDFRIACVLDKNKKLSHDMITSIGMTWRAPEQLNNEKETTKVDLFNLGCMIYFILTKGCHPYKFRHPLIRNNSKATLTEVSEFQEFYGLIDNLVAKSPDMRPSALDVLIQPIFWSSCKKLNFLSVVGDNRGIWFRGDDEKLLEKMKKKTMGKDLKWISKLQVEHLQQIIIDDYVDGYLPDLLRVIRNTRHHYGQYSTLAKRALGDDIFEYFNSRFPKLFMTVYQYVCDNCKGEYVFEDYFNPNIYVD